MKVEKISENQIKVVLSTDDLIERDMSISEVAHGSEKGQKLFQEVMLHAIEEYGFQYEEGAPLIIEAIPLSQTEITFIITKITNSEDIDRRLNFLPRAKDAKKYIKKAPSFDIDSDITESSDIAEAADLTAIVAKMNEDIVEPDEEGIASFDGLRGKVYNKKVADRRNEQRKEAARPKTVSGSLLIYMFKNLDDVVSVCVRIADSYNGENALYKMKNKYYLIIHAEYGKEQRLVVFERIFAEYGQKYISNQIAKLFLAEHGELVASPAVEPLAKYLGNR